MKVTRTTRALLKARRRKGRNRVAQDEPQAPAPKRQTTTLVRLEPPNVWPFPRAGWHRREP